MEEFIHAEVNSYDAIINSKGEPIFETGNVSPVSIMNIVNNDDNSVYYIVRICTMMSARRVARR